MFKKRLALLAIGTALMSLTGLTQEDYTQFKREATVQALGGFVTQTKQNGVQPGATDSVGVLATYRYYLDRHNGLEVNYAWSSNTQTYNQFAVDNNSHEFSAAYIFRIPMRRWSPFVLAGAGALIFDPRNSAGANAQARAAFVYGAGTDLNLTSHLFLRAEYRGVVYDSPIYDLPALNALDRVTHRAEPSIGFGWRF
jgi:opacity protein-like surface antigen